MSFLNNFSNLWIYWPPFIWICDWITAFWWNNLYCNILQDRLLNIAVFIFEKTFKVMGFVPRIWFRIGVVASEESYCPIGSANWCVLFLYFFCFMGIKLNKMLLSPFKCKNALNQQVADHCWKVVYINKP